MATQQESPAVRARHVRRSSANESRPLLEASTKLRLQTSVSNTKSKKSSPLERRRRSHRPKSPEPTSSSSSDDEAKAESSCTSSLPPQINPSHKLREAVERALGQEASQPGTSKSSAYGWALPKIVEPPIDESIILEPCDRCAFGQS